ncbi:MAG TPA: HAD family hydrolase [Xanthobacteraceae bacterium]|nr:HAD family hydrolase [Xanthobacteraceae bacterium]
MVKAAVFLDRDGVINANLERDGKPVAPTRIEEFRFLPGVQDAIRRLKEAGYTVIVCTNQPDVATGRTSRSTLDAMHALVREKLKVDDIKACFHTDQDGCGCRKPKPGMLLAAAREHGIDLAASYMVGDRWRDVMAGRAAGCRTIFVDYGYRQDGPNEPDHVVASLPDAVDIIVGRGRQKSRLASNQPVT